MGSKVGWVLTHTEVMLVTSIFFTHQPQPKHYFLAVGFSNTIRIGRVLLWPLCCTTSANYHQSLPSFRLWAWHCVYLVYLFIPYREHCSLYWVHIHKMLVEWKKMQCFLIWTSVFLTRPCNTIKKLLVFNVSWRSQR